MEFIRFKNISPDEISNKYDGDLGVVGKECGVSCFEFVQIDGFIKILLSSVNTGLINDLSNLYDHVLGGEIPSYIIEAKQVGIGTYGEPVVKNITILYELEMIQPANSPPKFKQDNNIQLRKCMLQKSPN